jgi:hypothetical protein
MVKKSWFTDEHDRVEIPDKIKMDVFKRVLALTKSARFPDGDVRAMQCEGCGLVVGSNAQFDHTHPECFNAMHPNERPPITAADVKRLGNDCCHKKKSKGEVKARAKTDRLAKAQAERPAKGPSQWRTGKDSPWKSKVGGGVVRRNENE